MESAVSESAGRLVEKDRWVLGAVLERQAELSGDRDFFQFEDHASISYGDFNKTVNRVAHGLTGAGVKAQDRVMIMTPNSTEFVVAWFALAKLGAVTVPVNTSYKGKFLDNVANNCGAEICISHPDFLETWLSSEDNCPTLRALYVIDDKNGYQVTEKFDRISINSFASLYADDDSNPEVVVNYFDPAVIMYTSGTTGVSKGVAMPHAQLFMFAQQSGNMMRIDESDIHFTCLPLFHVAASFLAVYCMMLAGGKVVLSQSFRATAWIDQIRDSGATVTHCVGVMAEFIHNQPRTDRDGDNNLRLVWFVPMPEAIIEDFASRFGIATVLTVFGMTELSLCIHTPWDEHRPGSCGKAVDQYFEMKIVDPETDEEMPDGQVGELVCRPKVPWVISQGYFGMPEASLQSWRNLWFHTGDLLKRDSDGFFYFVDRVKDALRRRGENISSFEVESVVLRHPDVLHCAVVGTKATDVAKEDEVKACIVLKPDAEFDPASLVSFCDDHMPHFMVPRYFSVWKSLPTTPSGKIRKFLLRDDPGEALWDRVAAGVSLKDELRKEARRRASKAPSAPN